MAWVTDLKKHDKNEILRTFFSEAFHNFFKTWLRNLSINRMYI